MFDPCQDLISSKKGNFDAILSMRDMCQTQSNVKGMLVFDIDMKGIQNCLCFFVIVLPQNNKEMDRKKNWRQNFIIIDKGSTPYPCKGVVIPKL